MLAVIAAIKLTQAVMLLTFSRVLMSCRESMLLLDLRFSTSKFSRLRRLLWWSWIRSYVQFRRDTTLISVPPPEAVQTGWRPRDDTSCKNEGKHWNLERCGLALNFLSHQSRAFSSNGKRHRPGWGAKDILAHCVLCRRCSEWRIVCASTAMIGWTASRGLLYILKRCRTYPWHLGRKLSQAWSNCTFKRNRSETQLKRSPVMSNWLCPYFSDRATCKTCFYFGLTQKRQWSSNLLSRAELFNMSHLVDITHLLVDWDEKHELTQRRLRHGCSAVSRLRVWGIFYIRMAH